jgi:hypothetical protein
MNKTLLQTFPELIRQRIRSAWDDKQQRDLLLWYGASVVVHGLILCGMALVVLRAARETDSDLIVVESIDSDQRTALDGPIEPVAIIPGLDGGGGEGGESAESAMQRLSDLSSVELTGVDDRPVSLKSSQLQASMPEFQIKNDFSGRSTTGRGKLVGQQGGSEASERAVKLGLQWLAERQEADGGWNFKHGDDSPGSLAECRTAATGLALLAFLGAGHTQRVGSGEYRTQVGRGLQFLTGKIKYGADGGDLRGKVTGNEGMYAHAIATLALCEAFAMSRDSKLKNPAQRAIDFIVSAQEKTGGGWRYKPGEPGDTTVTGWQLMALKSAKAGQLKVPDETVKKAAAFLDSVLADGGAQYRYLPGGGSTPGVTAIGVLCRMYLGWTPENPALEKGVTTLDELGPDPNNLYYNYYATQALHHWGGKPWSKWNTVMRERLVKSQVQEGKGAGSWNPTGDHGSGPGGRLYQTTLSIMTLEVYYRYMPMYHRSAGGDDKL